MLIPGDINQIWCGGHSQKPALKLRAGDLSMIYEGGNIRYISADGNEIIRMIYSAVRDREWLTVKPVITNERIERGSKSFRIVYYCLYRSGEINFSARYIIEGLPDNTVIFSFEGEALDSFLKNRIGFCVLHPVEACSGRSCIITHSDLSSKEYSFPIQIDPLQPFTDIVSMKWKTKGMELSLDFSGELFETEDQRNWTDASYKTYCTLQNLPSPVEISKGKKLSQKIILRAAGKIPAQQDTSLIQKITINPEIHCTIPKIGICRSTRDLPLAEGEIEVLKNICFDHYRTDLFLFTPNWTELADIAAKEAYELNYSLELALFLDDDFQNQSTNFIRWLPACKQKISVITLFHKTEPVTPVNISEFIVPLLKKVIPGVVTGIGTNANFAQLNFNRPPSASGDLICYSIQPQEHASDNTTLTENLEAQTHTVESARQFSDGKAIWISTVNIQRRFNANIENFEKQHSGNSFPPQVDSRLMSLFGACWTAGSLKYLCESGAAGVTYYETVGERGIIQGNVPSRWPDKFQARDGMIFPAAFIFKFLLEDKSLKVIKSRSSDPLKFDALILSDGRITRIITFNFTSDRQEIILDGIQGKAGMIQLHAGNYQEAICDLMWLNNTPAANINLDEKLMLEPFSISFINLASG